MGATFDRWLAQPGTLHFLRQLVRPDTIRSAARVTASPIFRHNRRSNANISRNNTSKDGNTIKPSKSLKSAGPAPESPVQLNAPEVGLRISLNAGVAIFDKDGDPSQAYAELEFQSAVNCSRGRNRLVDNPSHRENFKLWVELLQFRQRVYGLKGVVEIWQGMRQRSVDLPVEGPEADVLWKSFTDAAFSHSSLLGCNLVGDLFGYAGDLETRTERHYPRLYRLMVGRHFRKRLPKVRKWHDALTAAQLRRPQDLASIIEPATWAVDPRSGFQVWLSLFDGKVPPDIYDVAISEILKLEDVKLALFWHRQLLLNGHAPSSAAFAEPAVQRLFKLDKNRFLPVIQSSNYRPILDIRSKETAQSTFPKMTRASMNTIVGDVHGIKQKEISDSFCARLFATRAFSLDLVIKGLSFLSVENLGPLAIREMAVRAGTPHEMSQKLDDMKKLGIKIGPSVYARLVMKAAKENDARLWNALLETDQHPDVYEDAATQEALIVSLLQQRRIDQAHLSLTALSWATSDAQHRAWNRVLQHHILNREYGSVYITVEKIRMQGLPLTLYSLTLLRRYLLPERRRGKRAVVQDKRPAWALHLVKNACVHTATKGGFVPINMWVELLKRFGMGRKWKQTEVLALWLFERYNNAKHVKKRDSSQREYLGRMRVRRQVLTLRLIFSPNMLRALFTWAFRAPGNGLYIKEDYASTSHESWARGLALLRQIQDRNMFDVTGEARTAFQQRMWMLFGAGYSTLRTNNLARLYNRISLAHYINHANQVWPGLVDWVDPELLKEDASSNPELLTQFFGPLYRTSRGIGEYANVASWAKHLGKSSHSHYMQQRSIRSKERAWKNSGIRYILSPVSQVLQEKEGASEATEANETTLFGPEASMLNAKYQASLPPEHQSPSAHSSNWRPRPSLRYIRVPH